MTPNERYDYGGVYEGDEDEDNGYYGYPDDGGNDGDEDEDTPLCPKCESEATYQERTEGVLCWNDINNPDEQGVTIIVTHHYCADCDYRWSVQHGRPLNVECDCD